MGRYQVHRSDATATDIIDALRKSGCRVEHLGRPVDVAVGMAGYWVLAEIKTARGRLRAAQRALVEDTRGLTVVLRSVDDALELVANLRESYGITTLRKLVSRWNSERQL